MEEKYRHCDETLSKLLTWIGEVEDKLATQDIVQEDADELRNQINIMKVTVLLLLLLLNSKHLIMLSTMMMTVMMATRTLMTMTMILAGVVTVMANSSVIDIKKHY